MPIILCVLWALLVSCTAAEVSGHLRLEGVVNKHFLTRTPNVSRMLTKLTLQEDRSIVDLKLVGGHVRGNVHFGGDTLFAYLKNAAIVRFHPREDLNYTREEYCFKAGKPMADAIYPLQDGDMVVTVSIAGNGIILGEDVQNLIQELIISRINVDGLVAHLRRRYFHLPVTIVVFRYIREMISSHQSILKSPTVSFSLYNLVSFPPAHPINNPKVLLTVSNYGYAKVYIDAANGNRAYFLGYNGLACVFRDGELEYKMVPSWPSSRGEKRAFIDLKPNDIVVCMTFLEDSMIAEMLSLIRAHLVEFPYQTLQVALRHFPRPSECYIKIAAVMATSDMAESVLLGIEREEPLNLPLTVDSVDSELEMKFPKATPVRFAVDKIARKNSIGLEHFPRYNSVALNNGKFESFARINLVNLTDASISTFNGGVVMVIRSNRKLAFMKETLESVEALEERQRMVRLYPGDLVVIIVPTTERLTQKRLNNIEGYFRYFNEVDLGRDLRSTGRFTDGMAILLVPVQIDPSRKTTQTTPSSVRAPAAILHEKSTPIQAPPPTEPIPSSSRVPPILPPRLDQPPNEGISWKKALDCLGFSAPVASRETPRRSSFIDTIFKRYTQKEKKIE